MNNFEQHLISILLEKISGAAWQSAAHLAQSDASQAAQRSSRSWSHPEMEVHDKESDRLSQRAVIARERQRKATNRTLKNVPTGQRGTTLEKEAEDHEAGLRPANRRRLGLGESEESKRHGQEAAKLKASGAHPEDVAKEIVRGKASKDPRVAGEVGSYLIDKAGKERTPYANLRARLAAKKSGRTLRK